MCILIELYKPWIATVFLNHSVQQLLVTVIDSDQQIKEMAYLHEGLM